MPAIAAFGSSVVRVDGGLDRAEMRRLVFSDASARARLEAILHPMIRRESEERCNAASAASAFIRPLVVPLCWLSQKLSRPNDAWVLVIDCDAGNAVLRVMARSGLSRR